MLPCSWRCITLWYYTAPVGGGDASGLIGSEQNFSKEVDDKANSYFQAIYNRGMSVDRLLDELKKFKESQNRKERVSTDVVENLHKWYYT